MLAVNVPFCLSRIKPPSSSAKPIGVKARKQAKLGKMNEMNFYCNGSDSNKVISFIFLADEGKKPLRLLEKVEKPIPRPPTPTIEAPSEVCLYNNTQIIHNI